MTEFLLVLVLLSLMIGSIRYINQVSKKNREAMIDEIEEMEENND